MDRQVHGCWPQPRTSPGPDPPLCPWSQRDSRATHTWNGGSGARSFIPTDRNASSSEINAPSRMRLVGPPRSGRRRTPPLRTIGGRETKSCVRPRSCSASRIPAKAWFAVPCPAGRNTTTRCLASRHVVPREEGRAECKGPWNTGLSEAREDMPRKLLRAARPPVRCRRLHGKQRTLPCSISEFSAWRIEIRRPAFSGGR